ncbi:chemotaxis-specific protein-glutamate methyltransferase CheB [Marichromatium gracile]|uniref:Protein-glutamate methylesterase/protein-glutamine glutaminase n=3 Tax=Marichromatium gracile TaxID=1048 RepID=A0A4R4ABG0_MARGR|nr:chemotaxis-specific protein-glutamate methyltransferase CheB [Marichromatium gracile]TCW36351.1 two-component system chemotaxis response regulator CheB [Marichromatium gracile]
MSASRPIRVLVVDDSPLARALIRTQIEAAAGLEVCAETGNGREALRLTQELAPDIITMDLQMPGMGGLETIAEIMSTRATPILVVSDLADADNAMAAVAYGALDALPKEALGDASRLAQRLRTLAGVPVIRHIRRPQAPAALAPTAPEPHRHRARVVAIAASTGGPHALAQILAALPPDFPAPLLIAQHIADGFAQAMAAWLDGLCPLPVAVAEPGEALRPGRVHIADPGQHLGVDHEQRIQLSPRAAGDIYRPSCDHLLESVAAHYGARAVGVILTGMGRDGARGLLAMRRAGAPTIAQDEASSVIFGMNREAIVAGAAAEVLTLAEIPPRLCALTGAVAPAPS